MWRWAQFFWTQIVLMDTSEPHLALQTVPISSISQLSHHTVHNVRNAERHTNRSQYPPNGTPIRFYDNVTGRRLHFRLLFNSIESSKIGNFRKENFVSRFRVFAVLRFLLLRRRNEPNLTAISWQMCTWRFSRTTRTICPFFCCVKLVELSSWAFAWADAATERDNWMPFQLCCDSDCAHRFDFQRKRERKQQFETKSARLIVVGCTAAVQMI